MLSRLAAYKNMLALGIGPVGSDPVTSRIMKALCVDFLKAPPLSFSVPLGGSWHVNANNAQLALIGPRRQGCLAFVSTSCGRGQLLMATKQI